MASLRFKKDGTPFVDFRAHSRRHRPEFLSVKDAQNFYRLADVSPEEAYRLWQESINQPAVVMADPEVISLKEKIESFKSDYCGRKANSRDMKRTADEFLEFILARKRASDPNVVDVDLKAVSLEDLMAFQTHLSSRKITNASVNRYYSTIKTFFRRAQKAQYITVNYALLVEGLEVEFIQRQEVWQDEDSTKLVDELIKREWDQVLIDIARSMEFSPFGPTDYKRIRWSMVDFDHGVIRTFRMKGKGKRPWPVPIVLGYQKLLIGIRKRQQSAGTYSASGFVYLTEEHKPVSPVWVSKALERARKAAGITSVPYTSRHRVITMVNEKTDLKTASKFAGHASTKTTERHYVVEGEEEFKNKVNEAFAE